MRNWMSHHGLQGSEPEYSPTTEVDGCMHQRQGFRKLLAAAALGTALLATPAVAQDGSGDGRFYGMLRSRDLTPFGFLRLDMRPAHAISIESRSFAIEADLGYQNTWALSRNVEKY